MSLNLRKIYDHSNSAKECLVFDVTEDDNLNNYSISGSKQSEGNYKFPDWSVKKGTTVYLYTTKGKDDSIRFRGEEEHILFRGSDKAFWAAGDIAVVKHN